VSDDPIAAYLADFADELGRLGPRRRRLLAEIEDHLREAAARLEHGGASPEEAARLAVAQFGSPEVATGRVAGSGVGRALVEMRALGWRGGVAAGALIVAACLAAVGVDAGRGTIRQCAPHVPCLMMRMGHPVREDGYLAASALTGLVTAAWLFALGRHWRHRHRPAWRGLLVVIVVGVVAGVGTGGWVRQHAPRGCPTLASGSPLIGWCRTQSAREAANRLHRAEWYWLGAAGLSLLFVASLGDPHWSDSQTTTRIRSAIPL
jgi:hypothetical protein